MIVTYSGSTDSLSRTSHNGHIVCCSVFIHIQPLLPGLQSYSRNTCSPHRRIFRKEGIMPHSALQVVPVL
jgi:hypothetical protein